MKLFGSRNARLAVGTASAVVLAAACGGGAGADKVGGQGQSEPVTLTFSNPYSTENEPGATSSYLDQVERLSGGTIEIELAPAGRDNDPQLEQTMLDDVRNGVVDVAVLLPRFFSTIGVDRVAALAPPMLIDSYELEHEVFEAGLPDRFLGDLDEAGVVGIAALPGALQKIVGFDRKFRSLDDFSEAVVGAGVGLGEDVLGALGATSRPWVPGSNFEGYSGMVFTVGAMLGRHTVPGALAATGNLNLFAAPSIVIMNAETFESLDASQQAAMRDAGPAAVDAMFDSFASGQAEAVAALCDNGLEFVTMTDDDVSEVRTALDPIYTNLAADAEVAVYIAEIEQLKAELGVPPDTVSCPESTAGEQGTDMNSGDSASPLDGSYERLITLDVWVEMFGAPEPGVEYPFTAHLVLSNGEWMLWGPTNADHPDRGTYTVFENHLTTHWATGTDEEFTYVIDPDGNLQMTALAGPTAGKPFVWQRIDDGSADNATTFPDGTFLTTRLAEYDECPEWTLAEPDGQLRFDDGVVEFRLLPSDEVQGVWRYSVFEDKITVNDWVSATWSFDRSVLTFTDIQTPAGEPAECGDTIIWAGGPWILVPND